jgi:WD40 repeat protein
MTPGSPVAKGSRTGISISAAVLLPVLVIGVVTYLAWPKGPAQSGTVSSPSARATTSGSPRPAISASLTIPGGPITLPTGTGTDVATSAFSTDGKLLATEELNLTHPTMPDRVVIWNAVTGAYVRTVALPSGPLTLQGLAFSPDDERLIAVAVSQGAYQWDVSNGRASVIAVQVRASDPRAGSTDVAVSADGTTIASVDASGDGVDVQSTAAGAVVAELADPDHAPIMPAASGESLDHAVGLSAGGQVLSVADTSGNVYIWNVPSRRVTRVIRYGYSAYELAGHGPDAVTLSPAGNLVLLARDSSGGSNTLWSTASGTEVHPAGSRWASDADVGAPLFSLDGRVIVAITGNYSSADFWNATNRAYLGHVAFPGRSNTSIYAVGPGGKELVTDDESGDPYLASSPY